MIRVLPHAVAARHVVAQKYATELCPDFDEKDPVDQAAIISDIADALKSHDAYEAAKTLDDHCWAVDFGICEMLDVAISELFLVSRDLTRKAIAEAGLKPKYAIGQTITWCAAHKKPRTGVISGTEPDMLTYLVPDVEGRLDSWHVVAEEDITHAE